MEQERSLDPQLWHACAGSMVQIPSLNSTVFYFPQGHAEHAHAPPDFHAPRVPPLILCRVASVKFLADSETDEVYSKITLLPLPGNDLDLENDAVLGLTPSPDVAVNEKPASFAKTLTQSDANNGGGFSVPRYCAETIFPRLDYTAEPPVQTVIAKDIHGETWKFRHIYRGTPRRHLLTTGWSTFVNQKKLIAGDSIVFLRSETGDLCVGIRRAKRGGLGSNGLGSDNNNSNSNNNNPYPGFSGFLRDDEITASKLMMMKRNATAAGGGGGNVSDANAPGGRVRVEAVAEAVARAACGQAFEVVYYPRASTPEFCVKASDVRSAMRIRWCSGMRFKMAFETEDSSRISWFMGTVSAVQVADPIRWPNSPWRLLQVAWDEPDLLQNVKRVSPWLVELVSNMPAIHLSPFSPRKKLRIPQPFDFPFDGTKFPVFSPGFAAGGNNGESMCYLSNDNNNNNNAPAGIQGARQAQQLFGSPSPSLLSDLNLNSFHSGNKLQQSSSSPAMFLSGFNPRHHHFDNIVVPRQARDAEFNNNNISCSLTIGNPGLVQDKKKSGSVKLDPNSGALSGLSPGGVLVDMTTSEPSLAEEISKAATSVNCFSVDAPVSGGDLGAKNGKLSIFAGGDEATVKRLDPLFSLMGKVNFMGTSGKGQFAKLANQITIASTMLGLVEGIVYAHKAGLDVRKFLEAISTGAAGSKSIDLYGERILKRDFDPGFYVNHFVKDLGICLNECQRMGLALPGLALAQQLYLSLKAHGEGDLGTQALILALERLNNVSVQPVVA